MNNETKNVSIGDFLEGLPRTFNRNITRNFRAKNYQSFELGMDHLNDDKDYWNKMFRKLDDQFDLIILVEYYFESLVLLAEILCVPYQGFGHTQRRCF